MNFSSDNIKIYPAANRNYISGKLNLEYNITNLVNRLTDIPSFIITGLEVTYTDSTLTITAGECNIGGYFIKLISDSTFDTSISSESYVCLTLTTAAFDIENSYSIYELTGDDDQTKSTYSGLEISITTDSTLSKTKLPIAKITPKTTDTSTTYNCIRLNYQIKYDISNIQINPNNIDASVTDKPDSPTNLPNTTFVEWLNKDFIIDDGEI